MPKIIISERGRKEEWVHECKEDVLTIGRHDDNIVALPSQGVSRRHAQVIRDDSDFFVLDVGSGNGTYLNGMRINSNERYPLRNKDVIAIDTFDLRFYTTDEMVEQSYQEEVTESDILEVKLLKKVLKAFDKETMPSFEVLNGSAEGSKFHLTDDLPEFIVGRDPDVDFSINEHAISRHHAKIIRRWGGIAIRDLESKNGTFVNNRKVVEEYLHDGDRVALGTIVLMFRNPQEINVAQLIEKIPPKNKPAQIKPEEIPESEGLEEESAPQEISEEESRPQAAQAETFAPKARYPEPAPKPKIRLTPVEIGMIGLGALVFIFALITVVNLLFA